MCGGTLTAGSIAHRKNHKAPGLLLTTAEGRRRLSTNAMDGLAIAVLTVLSITAARYANGRYFTRVAAGATVSAALLSLVRASGNVDEYPMWVPIFVGAGISLLIFLGAHWTRQHRTSLPTQGLVTLAAGALAWFAVPFLAYWMLLIHAYLT